MIHQQHINNPLGMPLRTYRLEQGCGQADSQGREILDVDGLPQDRQELTELACR